MGYLYMAVALLCSTAKGFCGKKQSQHVHGVRGVMTVNFLRMLCCVAVGAVILAAGEGFGALAVSGRAAGILSLSGISNAAQVILWLLVVQRSAYMLLDVFATLGVIVPMLVCRVLFDEAIRPIQWGGYVLLCAAAMVMCSYSMSLKQKKMGAADYGLLLCFGLAAGMTDLTQKLYLNYCPEISKNVFNFYTFLFAAAVMAVVLLILCRDKSAPHCPLGKVWYYIVIMAVMLFLVTYFKTAAASVLPAVQVYPLFQGGVLVTAALMAAVCFGEKITRRCLLGMGMTFMAMLMMNVL